MELTAQLFPFILSKWKQTALPTLWCGSLFVFLGVTTTNNTEQNTRPLINLVHNGDMKAERSVARLPGGRKRFL